MAADSGMRLRRKNGQLLAPTPLVLPRPVCSAGMAMKWRWRKRMEAAGKPTINQTSCGPVQICWHKFARYWDVELREIPMRPGQLFMDPETHD